VAIAMAMATSGSRKQEAGSQFMVMEAGMEARGWMLEAEKYRLLL
jgi:hypothetical protein